MQALLSVCIGLTLLSSLAGQSPAPGSEVPGDQCLGGDLVAIQQNSIALKFNQKFTIMRVAPDAEIWRRGVYLENIHQLTVGDNIYLACTRSSEDGAVMASLVAAVEKGDGVDMEPHNVAELRACGGILAAIAKDSISVKGDAGVCVMRINANTEIWRGEILHDTSGLKLGDDISARSAVAYPSGELIAEEVDANIGITEGTIVAVRSDRIVIREHSGRETVLFDARTNFDLDGGELKKGATVRAVGLDLGHDMLRASTIILEN
jgi:Domain of unknown function (DUF5666)